MKYFVFSALIFISVHSIQAQAQKSGTIILINRDEIKIRNKTHDTVFLLGEKLKLMNGDKNVTLEVVFPMQTSAKCRLISGELSKIKTGMTVYSEAVSGNDKTADGRPQKSIDEFSSFLGFTKQDTHENVISKIGNPTSSKYSINKYENEQNCLIKFDRDPGDRGLVSIDLFSGSKSYLDTGKRGTKHFLKEKGVVDAKIDYLGASYSEIIKIFGKPDQISADSEERCVIYKSEKNKKNALIVRFYIGKKDDRCFRIYTYWIRN